jgi:glycosyltransferase involved in cell wall biosynthesis
MTTQAGQPGPGAGTVRLRLLGLAPNPWDGQWMNRQQILSRLAAHHAVLYSNGTWSVWDRGSPAWRRAPLRGAYEARDGVLVDTPPRWLLRWPTVSAYDGRILGLVQGRWRRQLARMGHGPVIAYLFHPRFRQYIGALGADHVVYQPYDLFRHMPGWTPELAALEARLLAESDAVIATSESTREALQAQARRTVHLVPNGVDGTLFLAPAAEGTGDPLAGIPHPRIGYVGSLNRKVDLMLIAGLARREPRWQFVLVGPQGNFDEETGAALATCTSLANVHLPGARPRQELPAIMQGLDVALMCYRSGTWMDSAYPLKLHEYLASGPPVVSTDLPSVRPFAAVVAVARTPDEWHARIATALRDGTPGTPGQRRAVAAANTWEQRVGRISGILASLGLSGATP